MSGLGTAEIEKAELSRDASETMHAAIERAGGLTFNAQNPPAQTPILVPDIDPKPAGADLKGIIAMLQKHDFVAVLKHRRAAAGLNEGADPGEKFFGLRIRLLTSDLMMEFCHFKIPDFKIGWKRSRCAFTAQRSGLGATPPALS